MAYEKFTAKARHALELAKESSREFEHRYIGTEHILLGLVREGTGTAAKVLEKQGVTEDKVVALMKKQIAPGSAVAIAEREGFTPKAQKVLDQSQREAEHYRAGLTGTEHLLIALLKEGECVATRMLNTLGASIQRVYVETLAAMGEDTTAGKLQTEAGRGSAQGGNTPALDQFSRDLTQLAADGKLEPVIGRRQEIERVIQILSRRTKNNPCVIGEPGVGKTAIAEGLAQMIEADEVPDTIKGKRILMLDMSGMVAGTKYRGEFEERIKKVIEEAEQNKNILLFIDEIHTIIGAGGAEGSMDASNILKPSLSRGDIQVIGATTVDEYRKRIEKDAALERRFQPVLLEEPSEEDTVEMLKGLRPNYEKHHHVVITDEALEAAAHLSARYISDRFLPDKAIDLIDEASSRLRLLGYEVPADIKLLEADITGMEAEKEAAIKAENYEKAAEIKREQMKKREELNAAREAFEKEKKEKPRKVTENEIAEVVAQWTKIPVKKLAEGEMERLRSLEKILHERVIGQEEAVAAVAKAVRRGRVGLKDPRRPIGSFLFLGPTGVGKTELSKALAEALFGTENAMIRVDMSEYMEKHSVSRMVGSPPGYVGYEEGGQLSEKVRRNPYSVILFDEIEKAHPDVFNMLLQVLDDGHITDAQGRKIDFKNTVLIMTSNAGAQNIIAPKRLGFSAENDVKANYEFMKNGVMEEVRRIFKPEFLNRIDETIVFHALTKDHMKDIVNIMLRDIEKRTKEQMHVTLQPDDAAKVFLVEKGYDEKYGARPLRRTIQNELEDPLAEEILAGRIVDGDEIKVSAKDGKITFDKVKKRGRKKTAAVTV